MINSIVSFVHMQGNSSMELYDSYIARGFAIKTTSGKRKKQWNYFRDIIVLKNVLFISSFTTNPSFCSDRSFEPGQHVAHRQPPPQHIGVLS